MEKRWKKKRKGCRWSTWSASVSQSYLPRLSIWNEKIRAGHNDDVSRWKVAVGHAVNKRVLHCHELIRFDDATLVTDRGKCASLVLEERERGVFLEYFSRNGAGVVGDSGS